MHVVFHFLMIIIVTEKFYAPYLFSKAKEKSILNLTIIPLWTNSADNKLTIFVSYFFFQKIGLDFSCKLPVLETVCLKYQSLFSGKNKTQIFQIGVC